MTFEIDNMIDMKKTKTRRASGLAKLWRFSQWVLGGCGLSTCGIKDPRRSLEQNVEQHNIATHPESRQGWGVLPNLLCEV
jgi:hypothetical protein